MTYLHSCNLNTKFDFTVPSLQLLRLNVVFGLLIFVSSLVERRLKYMLTAKRQILYKLDGRLSEKLRRKLSFLFVGKGKRFIMKLFFEEFNLIFFTAESPWPVLNATKAATFWRILKKNYKMCPDWRWRDFVLKFATCSADFSILA